VLRPAPDNAANWPAGSVFSNLTDLSRFVMAMMHEGQIEGKQVLSPEAVKALTTPHADIPGSHSKYGYGLDLDQRGELQVWSHGGSRAGYGSFIAMLPGRETAVIVLCNRTGESLPRTRAKIMDMLAGPLHEINNPHESAIPASEFSKFEGTYRNGETTSQILERDGKLYYRSMELTKGDGGWLIMKGPDGRTTGRVFAVSGPDGRIQYLHAGGRSSIRVP